MRKNSLSRHMKVLTFAILFSTLLISSASAYGTTLTVSNTQAQTAIWDMKEVHPASGAWGSAWAVVFNGTDYTLDIATFKLCKYGSPVGTLRAFLMGVNATGYPDGTVIEYGETLAIASLTSNPTFTDYNFGFSGSRVLQIGLNYSVGVEISSAATIDTDNYVRVALTPLTSNLTSHPYYSSEWQPEHGTLDCYFKLYGEADTGTGTGGPGIGWTPGNTDELIEDFANFIVPVAIMLLPAILFIIFFKRTDKWLILIGLAIGVGLGYYFGMVPVWLVFLVAIGLIGLAYSEVRRNG